MGAGFKANAWDWSNFKQRTDDDSSRFGGAFRQSSPHWGDEELLTEPRTSPANSLQEDGEEDRYPHPQPPRSAFSSYFDGAPEDYGVRMNQGPLGSGSRSAGVRPVAQTTSSFPETARNQ
jgi:hypothetical protein